MPITLNFEDVGQMRREMNELLGIPLQAVQGPTPQAKELVSQQERIASLEQNLSDLQFLLEGAKEELDRVRPIVTQVGSLTAERDEMQQKLDAATLEMKRLQDLVGVQNAYPARAEDAPKPKRTRKAPQREGGSLDAPEVEANPGDADHEAEMKLIEEANIQPIAGGTADPMAAFLALPQDTLTPGHHVLVHLDDENVILEGWCNRQFDGTDRWDVKLKRGGYTNVPAPRIRDFAKGYDDSPRDFVEEAIQKQRLGKPGADPVNPVPPKFVDDTNDGVVDRLVTHEERGELAQKAKDLKIPPERMIALMQREFTKNQSAELTVAEVHKLFGVMEADAKVPF